MNHGTSSVQEFSQRAGKVNAREHSELFGEEPAGKKAKIGEASRPDTYRTKLHDAVSTRDESAVCHILRNERDLIDVQEDSSKMTALHIAASHGCREIALMLLSAGSDVHLQNQSGMTALHIALKHKHEETAKVISDADDKNNIQDKDGKTVLYYAAKGDFVEIVKRLLASGADPRLQDRSGMTALHVALKEYCKKSVEVLIEADAESSYIQDKDGKSALHYAAARNFVEIVKRLLALGADTRLQDRSGMTAFHVALKEYCNKSAEVLIEADAESSNVQDKDGKTALHYAAARNYVEIVKKLLASGADTRLQDRSGMTGLHVALKECNKSSAEVLIEADAESSNIQDKDGKTALHYAAARNYVEIVKKLLASGADTRLQDRSGMTGLHVALKENNKSSAEVLIEADAESNNVQDKDGKTVLYYAAKGDFVEIVKRLLASGADPRLQDRSGMTALHVALKEYCEKSAKVLIEADAESSYIQDKDGKTALHYAAARNYVEIVKRLLASGADTRLQDRSGMTGLHDALKEYNKSSAEVLIEADAESSNVQDKDGKTALHYAAARNYVEIVKKLLASGADTRLQDRSGMTGLHVALKEYNKSSAEVLIEADAESSNVQDKDGKTALHYAAARNNVEIVKRLLASGADTRLQDRSGMTALHIAFLMFKSLSAEVLIEADAESSNIQDKDGKTALHRATETYHVAYHVEAVLQQLLFHEVNPHVSDNKGQYPLKAALSHWSECVAKLILSMCVLRSIDIDWKELDLDHDRTTFCAGLLSEIEAELRRMKQAKLRGTNLSYYDFVRGHVSRVARYLENENARSVLLVDDAARRFPNYGEFFTFKVRRAEKRRILNNKCLQCFAVLPKKKKQPSLPRICTDLILAHLSEREMQNFIASFRVKC